MLDYNLIIADLEEIVRLEPEFEFAWYDLGYMHSVLRNFEEAVEAYTKAIEVNPDFAEAWYNRGLIRLFLNQTEKGTHDLGKAGELGVFEAYSVIKRYGSHIISTPPVKEEDMNE
jgi:tetratricopeptide (TPR) repeat protein